MGSERRVEQNCGPMDKNRIMRPYLAGRASKGLQSPRSSRAGVVNPAARARKAVILTSGDLRCVRASGPKRAVMSVIALEKSAEGIVRRHYHSSKARTLERTRRSGGQVSAMPQKIQ